MSDAKDLMDLPPVEAPVPSVPAGDQWPRQKIPVHLTPDMRAKFQSCSRPVKVKVRVNGLKRTQMSVLEKEILKIEGQTSVQGVLSALAAAKDRWMEMECFRDISLDGFAPTKEGGQKMFVDLTFLEGDHTSLGVFTGAQKVWPEVRFNCSNIGGLAYSAHLDLQPNKVAGMPITDADGEGAAPWRRYFAWCPPPVERTLNRSCDYLFSTMALFRVGIRSNNPSFGNWTEYGAARSREAFTRNAATDEWVFDAGTRLGWTTPGVRHTLYLAAKRRVLAALDPSAVEGMPLGVSHLNGIHYDATIDRRQYFSDPELRAYYNHPVSGWASWFSLQLAGKYAGLASSAENPRHVNHIKTELKSHFVSPLFAPYMLVSANLRLGAVLAGSGPKSSNVLLNDRFYLESEHVRGYLKAGERFADGGLKGGSMLAAGSLQAVFPLPLPLLPKGLIAAHCFVDAAGTGHFSTDGKQVVDSLRSHGAASCGAGVHVAAIPILGTMGRLEFNCAYPLTTPRSPDEFKTWKFGL
eukprot:gene19418-29916_t